MKVLITGVAGFIGCNLAEKLLKKGITVVGIDNLSRGSELLLNKCFKSSNFSFFKADLSMETECKSLISILQAESQINKIWHLAANSDIPAGVADAKVDLKDTFQTTFYTLEIAKALNIPTILFASSSAIYGDRKEEFINENIGPLLPISNYGAMKLSSEAIISAATESYLSNSYIFRFPNVIGAPATHGVIYDFIHKLKVQINQLDVLGDGSQQKSYIHVDDLIDAMLFISENSNEKINYFNIGNNDEGVCVKEIAKIVVSNINPAAKIKYGIGNRGWKGDIPKFFYDTTKLNKLGFKPKLSSIEAVKQAVIDILNYNGN